MKRLLLAVLMIFRLMSIHANAFSGADINIREDMEHLIPNEVYEIIGDADSLFSGSLPDAGAFIEFTAKTIAYLASPWLKSFSLILGICILSSLMGQLSEGANGPLVGMLSLVSTLLLAVSAYDIIGSEIDTVLMILDEMNKFMNGMLGVMGSLYIVGGNAASAASNGAVMSVTLALLENIITLILSPILRICFALGLASAVGGGELSGINRFIRSVFSTVLAFVTMILSTVLASQNLISVSADRMAGRAVRFAASAFIPVVGSSVAEAARTLSGAIGMIRGLSGGIAIAVILALVLPPLISLFSGRMLFKLTSEISRLLGSERECTLLSELSHLYDFAIGVTVAFMMLFILSLALFAKSSTVIGV